MKGLAIAALLGSMACMYLVGAAVVAPRGSWLRTKSGIFLLIAMGVSLVLLPPQLTMTDMLSNVLGEVPMLAWPAEISKGLYNLAWVVTSVAAFLVGMRVWAMGKPGYREGAALSDASAASRVSSLLPLADTLDKALDVLAQARLSERDAHYVAEYVRSAGRRLAESLPPSDGALYTMVAGKVQGGPVAAAVTGYLLEGAGRRGARQG